MKSSIMQLQSISDALAKVQNKATISHDNGTMGRELLCHFWDTEDVADKDRNAKEVEIARAALSGNRELVKKLKLELELLPKAKINVLFKLLEPIRKLNGTKIAYAGGKTFRPEMENVQVIYASEDAINMELLEYEETNDVAEDRAGNTVPVIKMTITSGILDVKESIRDNRDQTKEIVPARAYITPISFRSMQIAGRIMYREENDKRKTYGMTEIPS